ncbi:myogenesis-regulating glycosidase-like isoform X2 [Camponotus floridanus]|uniref:myogenesis-regulating glycosidase-like isoform X1 n=1 Tax=Camponotus floridanus TaxID=104421 RepID=UPI000DC6C459|nr:myogenesis-regulating glycosidase-like isoform X1 [Camponotus floridanus]XP_025269485.1 myogenesis-regulating glycosidase-like isoform X2 [Camponotus floridanus]
MHLSIILLLFTLGALVYGDDDNIDLYIKNGFLQVSIINSTTILKLTKYDGDRMINILHTKLPSQSSPFVLEKNCGGNNILCVKSANVTYTRISTNADRETIYITRVAANPAAELVDCYPFIEGTQWFGGPEYRYQYWPIQHMYYDEEPYLPTHPEDMALSERYWLSSKGISIYVNETSPLFLDQNNYLDNHLCLIAKNKAPYRHRDSIQLNYELGVFLDPKTAHQNMVKTHLGKPTGHPDERMIQHPIWSTWARYKANITDKIVETYADEIIANKFNNSQIEIDDKWETCYGSAVFDPIKFPNVTALVQRLKQKGFRVTLWIHPFINRDCEPAYSTALQNSFFVKDLNRGVQMSWWQGANAATIDFTNPKAVNWWIARLKLLQNLGIDSFKFDAGEVSWLPQVANLSGSLDMQPGIFTKDYVQTLATNFNDYIEVRVGWRSQELPIFVRMVDKDSRWTWNNGLPTLITTLLQMNINGYVYVLPDMIGGNGYLDGSLNGTEYPPKELFIRWLQANVFMPSLQYSFVPWDYDKETIAICKKYTDLHASMTPEILNAMQQAITKGTPVNPPIWWIDPTNEEAHKINDEYLLGETILIAPVIQEGAISRDIYFPAGIWLDQNHKTISGPKWIRNYPAPLDTLPYFKKYQ